MLKSWLKLYLQCPVYYLNYLLKSYDTKIWLIGDGRSGTTWVSNLINSKKQFRESFEPFHPTKIKKTQFLGTHKYVHPEDENIPLMNIASCVFNGRFWHSRADSDNSLNLYDGMLIKDIFSNLFANWAYNNFDDIKIVLLIRNPFAVALSKSEKAAWDWITDPMELLNQEALVQNHLKPFEQLIRNVSASDNFILKQILIWSILHYVPFRQFRSGQIHILFYENVYLNPMKEMSNLSKFVGVNLEVDSEDVVTAPSKVVGNSIANNRSPIDYWQQKIPVETIERGLAILKAFNLDALYNEQSLPNDFNLDSWNDNIEMPFRNASTSIFSPSVE